MVVGETVLCMAVCNRQRKVGPVCRQQGGARNQVRATWWAPPGHYLRVACSLLDLICCFGYDWVQFDVEGGLLIYF